MNAPTAPPDPPAQTGWRSTRLARLLNAPVGNTAGTLLLMLATLAAVAYMLGGMLIPRQGWVATVFGQRVHYSIVAPNTVFNGRYRSLPRTNPCLIEIAINPDMMTRIGSDAYLAYISAHEIGHCLDTQVLNNSHGGLTPTSSYLEDYSPDIAAAETYADAYALRYLKTCNTNLAPLGWKISGLPCDLPDPNSITQADAADDPLELLYTLNAAPIPQDYRQLP